MGFLRGGARPPIKVNVAFIDEHKDWLEQLLPPPGPGVVAAVGHRPTPIDQHHEPQPLRLCVLPCRHLHSSSLALRRSLESKCFLVGPTPRSSSTCSPAGSPAGSCRRRCAPTWAWTHQKWASGPVSTPDTRSHRGDAPQRQGRLVPRGALHPAPSPGQRRHLSRGDRGLPRQRPHRGVQLPIQSRTSPQQKPMKEHQRPRDHRRQ